MPRGKPGRAVEAQLPSISRQRTQPNMECRKVWRTIKAMALGHVVLPDPTRARLPDLAVHIRCPRRSPGRGECTKCRLAKSSQAAGVHVVAAHSLAYHALPEA